VAFADEVLRAVEQAVGEMFAGPPVRASVSFVGVEPIEVLCLARPDGSAALLTLGMSRRPMGVDDITTAGPRAELIAEVYGIGGDLWRRLAVLAASPVVEGVVYADGMSIDIGEPLDPSSACTGGLIVASDWPDVTTDLGPVTILRFVPATSNELAFCRVQGSAALRDRWAAAGTDLLDLNRSGVDLS
jgi:hypothetical protein